MGLHPILCRKFCLRPGENALRGEDREGIVLSFEEKPDLFRPYQPYQNGIALPGPAKGVIAIDGSGRRRTEKGLQVLSAYTFTAGVVMTQ